MDGRKRRRFLELSDDEAALVEAKLERVDVAGGTR
jgi:hypothetical protein